MNRKSCVIPADAKQDEKELPAASLNRGSVSVRKRGWQAIRQNPVLFLAMMAAGLTAIAVPPSAAYADYFDWKTLTCLFCVLAVVTALRHIRFFTCLAQTIVARFGSLRSVSMMLLVITFAGSMLIANDMALLTFLPLGYLVLESTGKQAYMAKLFILQNIAANLGGMLTPFGNPQNLYLYTRFSIPDAEFVRVMLPPFLLAISLLLLCCRCFFPAEPMTLRQPETIRLSPLRTGLYLLLFALSVIIVFRVIPYQIGLIIIPAVLFFADREALRKVDYPLLLTFMAFFVFSGNMSRLAPVRALLEPCLDRAPMFFSTLCCQVISNVPSAILLSQFTAAWQPLLLGVNIGGTGTLIASLASLITFREYSKHNPGKRGKYLALFAGLNGLFLAALLTLEAVLGYR